MQRIGAVRFLRSSVQARRTLLSQTWAVALLSACIAISAAGCVALLGLRLQKLNERNGPNALGHGDNVSGPGDVFLSELLASRCLGQPDRR